MTENKENFLSPNQEKRKYRYKASNGYIQIYIPDRGYFYEHRLIMEEYLGRSLSPNETVHHKNHTKDDNRIENLELFDNNSSHLSMHGMKRRAKRLESISIPIFKGPRCADISDRSCFICGTNQTHLRKDRNYRPAWRKVDGKYICETCRGRERRSLTVPKPRKKTPKS